MLAVALQRRAYSQFCAHAVSRTQSIGRNGFMNMALFSTSTTPAAAATEKVVASVSPSIQAANTSASGNKQNLAKDAKKKGNNVVKSSNSKLAGISKTSEDAHSREDRMVRFKAGMDAFAADHRCAPAAVQALQEARKGKMTVDVQHLMKGIEACNRVGKDRSALELATWAFGILQADKVASVEVYESMMTLYAKFEEPTPAVQLMADFLLTGYHYTSQLLSTYVVLLAKHAKDHVMTEQAGLYFSLKDMSTKKGFHVHARVYLAVAERYCRMGASDKVLAVLKDMTENNHEPSPALCEPLLNAAMQAADVAVLRVLLSWYKSNFNMGLLDGQTTHVLCTAANVGDAQLALTAFQMLRESGLEPTGTHYFYLVRALLAGQDVVSAIEALQEMESLGVSCFTYADSAGQGVASFDFDRYQSIKSMLVESIAGPRHGVGKFKEEGKTAGGKQQLEALYFALVEQVRASKSAAAEAGVESTATAARTSPPRVVLDALIESAGYLGLVNKSFSMFQECSSLFSVAPDINTYNALLAATSARNSGTMTAVFSVFQDIEASCFPLPGVRGSRGQDHSFSILIEALVARKEFRILDQVIDHMLSSGALASPRSLRLASIGLALLGQEVHWAQSQKIRGILTAQRLGMSAAQITPDVIDALLKTSSTDIGTRLPTAYSRKIEAIREGQLRSRNGGNRGGAQPEQAQATEALAENDA